MKIRIIQLIAVLLILSVGFETSNAQKSLSHSDIINTTDLESHVSFLASPLLKGRLNGSPELEIAQEYIVSHLKQMNIKPLNGENYLQPYVITRNSIDYDNSHVDIICGGIDSVVIKEPVYQLVPTGPSDFSIEGEVIFAGYGLNMEKYRYNDFENIKPEGKILLIMNRAPLKDNGESFLFDGINWDSFMSIQNKITTIVFSRAKAVLVVMDPKSGYRSLEERYPGYAGELSSTKSLKGEKPMVFEIPGMPKIIFVHRTVADELLKDSGYSLEDLQNKIDSSGKPHSFLIEGKKLRFTETVKTEDITLNNIVSYIEGSDPKLKNEYVIFSAHIDHIGASGSGINPGADDNASGCAAVLSIAEAFQNLDKKPLRSLVFLWVSGEEIGLFGSKFYADNPLAPLDKSVAVLNMDMIGRIKGVADTSADNPMTGPSEVFVITGNQSSDLISIAEEADKNSVLDFNYSLSGRQHPLQLFARSDHYSFVKKDIPVLFFSTGLHTDYHSPGDVIEKIDFKKMELITETIYTIGYTIANSKNRLKVDNPFSSW